MTSTWQTRVRFANQSVELQVAWQPAIADARVALAEHPTTTLPPDLSVLVVPANAFAGACAEQTGASFETIYGRFMRARWFVTEHVSTVVMAPTRSPLRIVRPLVDAEGHGIHRDAARMVTERILPTFVQLQRGQELCFLHGATMANEHGDAMLVSGVGGVGKTSLALELGLDLGWSFLSDDLVPLDRFGMVHLNGSHPKLYAYNVVGDEALKARLLGGRSKLDKAQWALRKHQPNKIRRSISPTDLYGKTCETAPLRWMLLVERTEVDDLLVEPVSTNDAAQQSVDILLDELRKLRGDVERVFGEHDPGHTWNPSLWKATLTAGLASTTIYRVRVPLGLEAVPYRKRMHAVVRDVTADDGVLSADG